MVWAKFWAIFSHTHLVTLLAADHDDACSEVTVVLNYLVAAADLRGSSCRLSSNPVSFFLGLNPSRPSFVLFALSALRFFVEARNV
jgi:hypothetical protein